MKTTTQTVLDRLRAYESRNVTHIEPDGSWPIVWDRAHGVHVWDAEGRRYLDLTAAFGVAAAGHANPRVVQAGQQQMARLLHAMGDVHPHALKADLARALSRLTFERWSRQGKPSTSAPPNTQRGKTIFGSAGFEAVEAALKTAHLATGRTGVIAFEGAYHGLGYGALNATHRDLFRSPFRRQLREFATFVPFPQAGPEIAPAEAALERLLERGRVGAVLIEPIQARGGIRLPARGFLRRLRRLCDAHGALLVVDEIYTGFGRTGRWFAVEAEEVMPDLICLGKALTGGFPLSACVGRADLMDAAWPPSAGEALHTSTFLGHPVGCAMALAQLQEIARRGLVDRSAQMGTALLERLRALKPPRGYRFQARGRGLMAGLAIETRSGEPATEFTLAVMKHLLKRGCIILPEGEAANVLGFTPPLTLGKADLAHAMDALAATLKEVVPR